MKRSQALRTVVTRSGLALVLLVAALLASAAPVPHASDAHLNVYYFDVDQGDATLLLGPDFTILIDAGRHDRSEVVDLLRRAGVQAIDLFVLTHPHSDHIGQCDKVMDAFPVREVWMSGDIHTSRTFERCIDAILASDAYYYEPRAGEAFTIGSAHIEVVHPARVTGDFNNGSVALRIRYGDIVFLFTGDAEADAEREMMARSHDLQATILHLGHHGSRTSSTLAFLRAVNPEVAIYSAGPDNSYGHPHQEVVERVLSLGIALYGTDTHGTVTVWTDGRAYRLETERDPAGRPFEEAMFEGCAPGQINVNTAPESELVKIVNVGSVLAQRIIEGRPYYSLDDLRRVSGIGAARLEQIRGQGLACAGPMTQ